MRGVWWCVVLCAAQCGAGEWRAPRLLAAPAAFELETTVLLNDVTRSDKEVGYQIRAGLQLVPLWSSAHTDFLLQFTLKSPKLHLRGKHVNADFMPYDSVWDSYSDTTFYAHWSNGVIKEAYLDPSELPDVLNYKKSILSLFQFQELDGEYNETDVSGACLVLYETLSKDVFRKIKRSCSADEEGAVSGARRVTRYTLDARALLADELLTLGDAALGLKARSLHALRRAAPPAPAAPAAPAATLAAALRALPPALRPLSLALAAPDDDDEEEELLAVVEGNMAALSGEEAGGGGAGADAAAALQLLPALRRANASALLQLLRREDMQPHLPGLCRLLGLTATSESHAAASDFLQLHAAAPPSELAQHYLAGLALAPEPHAAVIRDLLRLAAPPALLAAAAAAPRAAAAGLADLVRDTLARDLARCRAAACRAPLLRALGNLRRADTADLLLDHAERGQPAALDALLAAPPRALSFARLDRLTALALNDSAALELRAAALDLLVQRRAALPAPLAHVAQQLHERGAHELRRVLWQRMEALAPQHGGLRALPRMLGAGLRGWDARAHGGSSAVLVRDVGWAAGGWRARLDSLQVASAGLLRRGAVRLLASDQHNNTFDLLGVEVWTRGLEAFSGGSDAASDEAAGDAPAEEAAGGLSLSVGGVRLRDISLFNGQAELLGHVWAGTGSTATPVLRALLPLSSRRGAVPLLGGAVARADCGAAAALALDAQAQASLWWRSAGAALELRGGAARAAAARVRTAWGELSARAAAQASSRLRVAAQLDFYSGVALCVRVETEAAALARRVELRSAAGARRLRVRRRRGWRAELPGRTLALGRPNDVVCRTLRSADADHD